MLLLIFSTFGSELDINTTGKMDMKLIMKAIFRTMCIIANNLYAIPAYLVWMTVLLPLRYSKPRIYWFIEGHLFHWMLKMVSNWSWTAGYAGTTNSYKVTYNFVVVIRYIYSLLVVSVV